MPNEDDYGALTQRRERQQVVETFLRPRLERARRLYGQALTSLWVGNAGAALATLSFIGAAWKNGSFPKPLIYPLASFLLGVILMGLGALITLIKETRSIERIQRADSPLDLLWDDIKSPAESIGLTLRDCRTIMALLSGMCFVVGCIFGLIQLAGRAI